MSKDQILLEEFITNHPAEAANILEQMNSENVSVFISKLDLDLSVNLIREMDVFLASSCLEKIELDKAVKIIEKLPIVNVTSILRRINVETRNKILEKLDTQLSISLSQMMKYSDNSVGALINPQVHVIENNLIVKEALEKIKKNKNVLSSYVYVIDNVFNFIGVVALKDLIAADSKEQVSNIVDNDVPYLFPDLSLMKIQEHSGWHDYDALPVTDRQGIFLGSLDQTAIRKIEIGKRNILPKQAVQASNALGELFRIGLSGLLFSTKDRDKEKD